MNPAPAYHLHGHKPICSKPHCALLWRTMELDAVASAQTSAAQKAMARFAIFLEHDVMVGEVTDIHHLIRIWREAGGLTDE